MEPREMLERMASVARDSFMQSGRNTTKELWAETVQAALRELVESDEDGWLDEDAFFRLVLEILEIEL